MLEKKYRLKKYSAFIATYKNNDVVSDKNICLYFGKKKTDYSNTTKIAFVVSKKIHKRAVIRNRIKRLMRESIRKILTSQEYQPIINKYMSIVCVAKQDAISKNFFDISSSLNKLISTKK